MIRLEGITKSFGGLQVLRGIDLEIEKGGGCQHCRAQRRRKDYLIADYGYAGYA